MSFSEHERPWLAHYEPGVPHTLEYPQVPLHHLLEESARRYPDQAATIFYGATLTYGELEELANKFARALLELGLEKGERIAIILPNCPQFLIGYYGALKAGMVVVATNPLYVERELRHQLKDCGAKAALALSKVYPLLKKVQPQTDVKHVIVTNIKEGFPPVLRLLFTLAKEKREGHRVSLAEGDRWLQDLLKRQAGDPPRMEVKPDDVAIFQYTGGTTGTPKGAVATHFNLVANVHQIDAWFGNATKHKPQVFLGALPFFHVYGMVACMNFAVFLGGTIILIPRFQVDEALRLIQRYQPAIFPGVPTMYVAINNHPQVKRYNLESIEACISGAAPLPLEVKQRFEELTGGKLFEGYGLSEAPTASCCNPIYGVNKSGSIGLPMPDVDVKIVDVESGEQELPQGEVGELCIQAPNVMKGYWNRPEETEQALRGGWLHTGDIARMDEEGYLYIVDRKKDMIIAGGFNIYPREVEEVLYQHPKVREAAVVGVPDPYRGETVKAFVVLKEGVKATADEILGFCRERLAKYKVPTSVEFRKDLPKTLVGKVLRRVLAEEARRSTA